MVGGQADDLAAEHQGGDLAKLEAIHHRKTAAMLVASLRMGALVAEAGAEPIRCLSAYGRSLGLAFQITDDLLDQTGDAGAMGKRTGQDQFHGKLTFPGLLGVEESRRRATVAIEDAIAQLQPFGERAAHLQALARFVLERNR
jgi:geranylgeranyl diphosphate synthase type II